MSPGFALTLSHNLFKGLAFSAPQNNVLVTLPCQIVPIQSDLVRVQYTSTLSDPQPL